MKTERFNLLCILLCLTQLSWAQGYDNHELITPQQLMTWNTLDKGERHIEGDAIIIEEITGADGYFLISPKRYASDMLVRYKIKAMSESSVLITLFSVTDDQSNETLLLPAANSTGAEIWKWRSNLKHYNLTFNNVSHNYKPFFFKSIDPQSIGFRRSLSQNISEVGVWNDVEIGKDGNRLWFSFNGEPVFDVEDCDPFQDGHILFRISGTTGENIILAKAAIKDLVISTK